MFSEHPQIRYLGRHISFCNENGTAEELESMADNIRRDLQTAPSERHAAVLSYESIVPGTQDEVRRRFERLKAVFDGPRVLLMIRRPSEVLESLYLS